MEPTQQQPTTQPTDQQFTIPSPTTTPSPTNRKSLTMLSVVVVAIVLILVVSFAVYHKRNTNRATTVTNSTVLPATQVTITANGFNPATISVKKGQTVIWTSRDTSPHQPASDPYPAEDALPGFVDEAALTKGETYGFKFDQTGTFTYHDHLNPLQLKGTVIVK